MGMAFVYYIALLLFGFIAMYCLFNPQAKRFDEGKKFTFLMQPIVYIYFLFVLGALGAYFLADNSDFIAPLNLEKIIIYLLCPAVIYSFAYMLGQNAMRIALVLCVAACIFLQPMEDKFVPFGINEYVFKCLTVIFFSIFCLFYRILNILPHTIVIASVSMLFGVSLLSSIGGAPVYLALSSAVLIGSLIAYLGVNLHKIKIELDDVACTLLAFMMFLIFSLDIQELSFGSCIIFTMIFWAELAVAAYNKFLVHKSPVLIENTHFFAVAQKLTLASLMSNIFKIGIICMFFGWFQLFSLNQYSLPIVTFFVVLWLDTSMGTNLLQAPKTLKQINSEFVNDIKQNLKETKETITQFSKKKDS